MFLPQIQSRLLLAFLFLGLSSFAQEEPAVESSSVFETAKSYYYKLKEKSTDKAQELKQWWDERDEHEMLLPDLARFYTEIPFVETEENWETLWKAAQGDFKGALVDIAEDMGPKLVSCYVNRFSAIAEKNEKLSEDEKIRYLSYDVEDNQCVYYVTQSDDYKNSAVREIHSIRNACYKSKNFGELHLPHERIHKELSFFGISEESITSAFFKKMSTHFLNKAVDKVEEYIPIDLNALAGNYEFDSGLVGFVSYRGPSVYSKEDQSLVVPFSYMEGLRKEDDSSSLISKSIRKGHGQLIFSLIDKKLVVSVRKRSPHSSWNPIANYTSTWSEIEVLSPCS